MFHFDWSVTLDSFGFDDLIFFVATAVSAQMSFNFAMKATAFALQTFILVSWQQNPIPLSWKGLVVAAILRGLRASFNNFWVIKFTL